MPVLNAVASAARTSTGSSSAVDVPYGSATIAVHYNVTAVSGTTPSLTLSVEWSNDGTTWAKADPADAFPAVTVAGLACKAFTPKGDQMRIVWTISGTTPSFTFSAAVYYAGD